MEDVFSTFVYMMVVIAGTLAAMIGVFHIQHWRKECNVKRACACLENNEILEKQFRAQALFDALSLAQKMIDEGKLSLAQKWFNCASCLGEEGEVEKVGQLKRALVARRILAASLGADKESERIVVFSGDDESNWGEMFDGWVDAQTAPKGLSADEGKALLYRRYALMFTSYVVAFFVPLILFSGSRSVVLLGSLGCSVIALAVLVLYRIGRRLPDKHCVNAVVLNERAQGCGETSDTKPLSMRYRQLALMCYERGDRAGALSAVSEAKRFYKDAPDIKILDEVIDGLRDIVKLDA